MHEVHEESAGWLWPELLPMALSRWMLMMSSILQGSALRLVLFIILVKYTLSKSAGDAELSGAADTAERTDAIHKDLNELGNMPTGTL